MGSVYDLDNVEYNPRCSDVKGVIIIFTYSCAPITFILLTYLNKFKIHFEADSDIT